MSGVRDRFFSQLSEPKHVRILERTAGTILAEIKDGKRTQRWYVTIHKGEVSVSRSGSKPDCVIRTDGATFDAILTGKLNAMPALLRGLLDVEGDVALLAALQALFRPSSGATDVQAAGYARRL